MNLLYFYLISFHVLVLLQYCDLRCTRCAALSGPWWVQLPFSSSHRSSSRLSWKVASLVLRDEVRAHPRLQRQERAAAHALPAALPPGPAGGLAVPQLPAGGAHPTLGERHAVLAAGAAPHAQPPDVVGVGLRRGHVPRAAAGRA